MPINFEQICSDCNVVMDGFSVNEVIINDGMIAVKMCPKCDMILWAKIEDTNFLDVRDSSVVWERGTF